MQTHYTTNSQHGPVKLTSNAVVHTAGAPIETCVIGTTEPAVRLRLQQRSVYPNRDGRPALFPTRLEIRKLPPGQISLAMTGNQSTAVVAETVPQWQLRPISRRLTNRPESTPSASASASARGIGKALMAAALEYRRVDGLTVRASHNAVPSQEKSGFVVTGPPGELQGLKYVPVELICDG